MAERKALLPDDAGTPCEGTRPTLVRRNRSTLGGRLTTFGPPAGTRAGTAQRAVPTSHLVWFEGGINRPVKDVNF